MTGETDISQVRSVTVEGSPGQTNIAQSRTVVVEGQSNSILISDARSVTVEGFDTSVSSTFVSDSRSVVVEGPSPKTLFVVQARGVLIEAPWYERPLQNPIEVQVDNEPPLVPVYWPYQDPKSRLNPEAFITITHDIDQTATVANGENYTIYVTATKTNSGTLDYQWQYSYSGMWIDITNGQTNTLTIPITLDWNNKYLRCIVSDHQNKAQPVTTNTQLLTVV